MIAVSHVNEMYELKICVILPEAIRGRRRTTYIQTTKLGLGDI